MLRDFFDEQLFSVTPDQDRSCLILNSTSVGMECCFLLFIWIPVPVEPFNEMNTDVHALVPQSFYPFTVSIRKCFRSISVIKIKLLFEGFIILFKKKRKNKHS